MKKLICAALIACAGPAFAQDRMDMETCENGWATVMTMVMPDPQIPQMSVANDGWCLIEGLVLPVDSNSAMKIDTFKWRATDMARVFEMGLPPRSLEIVGTGFSSVVQTGDPIFDYLFGLQSLNAQSGFGLSVRWDGVQNAVIVDNAYVDFSVDNRIEATARIAGVNLTDMAAMQTSLGSMGLSELTLTTKLNGWFETYVAMTLGPLLLNSDGSTPAVQVAALQGQAIEIINNLPDAMVPVQSRDALAQFITSLPQPRGTARLQLSAGPPLGAPRMAPFALMAQEPTLDEIVELGLDGVTVRFDWTPMGDDK